MFISRGRAVKLFYCKAFDYRFLLLKIKRLKYVYAVIKKLLA